MKSSASIYPLATICWIRVNVYLKKKVKFVEKKMFFCCLLDVDQTGSC